MRISGGSPLKGNGGKDKGRKGEGTAWICYLWTTEFLVMPLVTTSCFNAKQQWEFCLYTNITFIFYSKHSHLSWPAKHYATNDVRYIASAHHVCTVPNTRWKFKTATTVSTVNLHFQNVKLTVNDGVFTFVKSEKITKRQNPVCAMLKCTTNSAVCSLHVTKNNSRCRITCCTQQRRDRGDRWGSRREDASAVSHHASWSARHPDRRRRRRRRSGTAPRGRHLLPAE